MKIAGRDAGKVCVVIDKLDDNYVMIDGQTRRRKCNIGHLEMIEKEVKVKKNASNKEVIEALNEIGIECLPKEKKAKEEKAARPTKVKKAKVAGEKKEKADKPKAEKKEKKKE
jgi:large subunit ribosomal protein L14e